MTDNEKKILEEEEIQVTDSAVEEADTEEASVEEISSSDGKKKRGKKKGDDPSSGGFVADLLNTSVKYFKWVVLIIVVGILLSGIRTVNQGEVAVILRFGKLCGDSREEQVHEPGLMFAFPYIIDEVITVPTGKVFELNVDTHYTAGTMSDYVDENGYCITGDQNIAVISTSLKYMITDPVLYALSTKDTESTVRGAVSSCMAERTLSMAIDSLLTDGKDTFSADVLSQSQQILDKLESGITITNFEINVLAPPAEVKEIFDQVQAANVEAQTLLAQAEQHRETIIPQAHSEASLLASNARIDQSNRVSAAQQAMSEFYGLLDEYERQPDVVVVRVYTQKITEIYKNIGEKIFVDENTPHIFIK